jgi:hypothetical protein
LDRLVGGDQKVKELKDMQGQKKKKKKKKKKR